MYLQINVTKKDIAKGLRSNPYACPVGRAVLRALKVKGKTTDDLVAVNDAHARLVVVPPKLKLRFVSPCLKNKYASAVILKLPKRVTEWVKAFDDADGSTARPTPSPIKFSVRLPASVLKNARAFLRTASPTSPVVVDVE